MEDCTFRIFPVCNWNPETTVYCHTNSSTDGKGMGLKSKKGAYGCSSCHDVVDGRAPKPAGMTEEELQECIRKAVEATDAILIRKGLPTMDDHVKAAKRIANKLAKGGLERKAKGKAVSKWAYHMKAVLKGSK
jgi:hypothetical protein